MLSLLTGHSISAVKKRPFTPIEDNFEEWLAEVLPPSARGSAASGQDQCFCCLPGRPSLPLLASPVDTVRLISDLPAAARDAAAASRAARREQMQAPAFRAVAISAMTAHGSGGVVERGGDEGTAGRDWGSLIHALLDYSVVNLACSAEDLAAVARWQAARLGAVTGGRSGSARCGRARARIGAVGARAPSGGTPH